MQELDWFADGKKVRDAGMKFGLRRIWATLYNANVAKKDQLRPNQIVEYWPLYTDKILTAAEKEAEEDELREQYKLLSEHLRNKDNADAISWDKYRTDGGSAAGGSEPT